MRKFLLFLGLIALAWVGFKWLTVQYGGKIAVPSSSPVSNVGERYGIVGADFGKDAAKPAAPATTVSSPATPAASVPENAFVCTRSVDAFDPAAPARQIGFFNAGSRLQIGGFYPASGMFGVTYQDPGGRVIQALCRPADVGQKPPETAATPSSGFPSPSGSSSPAQKQGTMSSWQDRIQRATGGN
ncbi:MAG: hypothetical protein ACOYMV_08350 [Verrucomicrobiia bacterium]